MQYSNRQWNQAILMPFNWAMKVAVACQPVLTLLHEEIRSGPLINIDETTVVKT